VTKRLPSEWNRKALDTQVKQLDHDLDKYFRRMKRIEERIKKAS
jgi:predicted  nucleic acid-binding Zn-ribbon protein